MDKTIDLEVATGDVTGELQGADELREVKDDLRTISTEISTAVQQQRLTNSQTRLCQWDGQDEDGRKHAAALGHTAVPFEGASDSRIRLADKIINERRDDYLTAATRSLPRAMGMEGTDEGRAGKLTTLVRWLIKNQWGNDYRSELELLAQWMEGDTPGLAVLGVFWHEERALSRKTVTREDVLAELMGGQEAGQEMAGEPAPPDPMELAMLFELTEMRDTLAAILMGLYPTLTRKQAKRTANALQTEGEADIPAEYTRAAPRIEALRMYDDIFFRAWVTDLQRAQRIFVRRWMTKAEVMAAAKAEGWDAGFVTELLGDGDEKGKAGQSALYETESRQENVTSATYWERKQSVQDLYEVLWCYSRAATAGGALGIYVQVLSGVCETAATGRDLLNYAHGEYPFVPFARERLTRRLVDTRSVSELAATAQHSQKLINDSIEDHVQVLTNPPLIVPKGNPKYQVALAPFGQIDGYGREKPEFLQRPPYPEAADRHAKRVGLETDDYFGRENAELPPNRAIQARQARVDRFLGALCDGVRQAAQLCQQFMSDEQVQRVVGGAGLPIARSVEEIQGQYDFMWSFDVRDLDSEFIIKKADLLLKVRPFDTQGILPWAQYVVNIVQAIDPNWADQIPPASVAQGRIIGEEQDNYVRILSGVEPEMPEKPENPELRMQVLQGLHAPRQQNPQLYGPVPPAAEMILENRMKYLQQATAQQENAVIGRIGTKPLELQGMAQGAGGMEQDAGGMEVGQ